jgi:cytochrome c553
MKRNWLATIGAVALIGCTPNTLMVHAQDTSDFPLWAYAVSTPPDPDAARPPVVFPGYGPREGDDPDEVNLPHQIDGSAETFTRMEIRYGHNVVDWFPGDHPPMTDIMRSGPASMADQEAMGCAFCHLPNGKGRPENAPTAGQPVGYTVQQLRDMAEGLRISADTRKRNSPMMNDLAAGMTDAEMLEAAEYFAAMPWTPWIEVIETELIPEMELEEGNMYITVGTERTEPLDGRIVETPVDAFQANYLRNPRSSWIAYVPVGSVARGENLVTTGGGKTVQCSICHGPDLMGLADFPGIAGRSPSYMMRQLWDMKVGTRAGRQALLMQPTLANLTAEDMRDIVAYLASLTPPDPMD